MTQPTAQPNIEAEVERQKTVLLFSNVLVSLLVYVVTAPVLAFVGVRLGVAPAPALAWLGAMFAFAGWRMALSRRFFSSDPPAADVAGWQRRYLVATAMSGATWGAAALVFMWRTPDGLQLLTELIMAGMVAGGVGTMAAVNRIFRLFSFLTLLPVVPVLLLQGPSTLHFAVAAVTLTYLAAMLRSAHALSRTLDRSIRLGLENERTASVLETALGDVRKLAEELRLGEERMRLAMTAANQYWVDLDIRRRQAESDPEFLRMLGLDPAHNSNDIARWMDETHPEDKPRVVETLERTLATGQGDVEYRRRTGAGGWHWVHTLGRVVQWDEQGQPTRLVGVHMDISERKQAQAQIAHLAFHDQLTGLPNRLLFLDRLEQAVAAARRDRRCGAIMFVDLDQFKHINDIHGHGLGDSVLREVANRLKFFLRQTDTVARFGGDEFVVLLPDLAAEPEGAATLALSVGEKIRVAMETPLCVDGHEHTATTSIGVTLFPKHGEDVDDLIREADIAMYRAKEAGRNAMVFFEQNMQAVVEARYGIEHDLRDAIRLDQFVLHMQSQCDAAGRVVGAEALLRWNHPVRGLVPPAVFIDLAEGSGLIVPIGAWVLERACRLITRLDAMGVAVRVAVNVSPRQFRQASFVASVRDILAATGADPGHLMLEITESLLVEHTAEVVASMLALTQLGVRFSLDDFGTGYSSLAYLKRLPLSELKIAKSFVQDVPHDPNDVALVETILSMAHHLGFEVVAEGVETLEQFDFLQERRCERFQGYLFHRPQPAHEWLESVVAHSDRTVGHAGSLS